MSNTQVIQLSEAELSQIKIVLSSRIELLNGLMFDDGANYFEEGQTNTFWHRLQRQRNTCENLLETMSLSV